MESALIVSTTEKAVAPLAETLSAASVGNAVIVKSCGAARRLLLERAFDLVIVNAPLGDESGEGFAREIASKGAPQVILMVNNEYYNAVSPLCEEYGVLTIPKPVDRALFMVSLKLAGAAQNRLRRMQAENSRLKQRIEDIRVVNRAKLLLISQLNMSEQEAHRYIEKQAMDLRSTKRAVAKGILNTYEL